jgi:replicative DNA helicase
MASGPVYVDDEAERTVAGCAIASAEGAAQARSRLAQADFYDGRYWGVIEATADLAAVVDDGSYWAEAQREADHTLVAHGCAARVDRLSATFGRAWLRALVTDRAVYADTSGFYADRVRRAAQVRHEVSAHLAALEALGVNVGWLIAEGVAA